QNTPLPVLGKATGASMKIEAVGVIPETVRSTAANTPSSRLSCGLYWPGTPDGAAGGAGAAGRPPSPAGAAGASGCAPAPSRSLVDARPLSPGCAQSYSRQPLSANACTASTQDPGASASPRGGCTVAPSMLPGRAPGHRSRSA